MPRKQKPVYKMSKKEKKAREKAAKQQAKEEKARRKKGFVGSEITGPTGFSHDSHVGWEAGAGFEIRNIPAEWKRLFAAAGATDEDLQNPETRQALVQVVKQSVYGLTGVSVTDPGISPVAPPAPAAPAAPAAPRAPSAPSAPSAPGRPAMPPRGGGGGGGGRPAMPPRGGGGGGGAPGLPSRGPQWGPGVPCLARWPVETGGDDVIYKARIESVRHERGEAFYFLTYTEYGNQDEVRVGDLQVDPDNPPPAGGGGGGGGPPLPSRVGGGGSGGGGGGGSLADQLAARKGQLASADTRELNVAELAPEETGDIVSSLARTLADRRKGIAMSVYQPTGPTNDDEWEDGGDDDSWMDF